MEDFDTEYDDIMARDAFNDQYGDLLTTFDDEDEFNDTPDWLDAMRDELEWSTE